MQMIEKTDKCLKLHTPYNAEFISKLKAYIPYSDRKWDKEEKVWVVDIDCITTINELLYDYFGYTENTNIINVKLTAKTHIEKEDAITVAGKSLIYVKGRDSGAYVSSDAIFVKGTINSSGSMRHPTAMIEEGSVFEIKIPDTAIPMINTEDWDIETVSPLLSTSEAQELLKEKHALLERLNEIETLLYKQKED